MWRHSGSSVCAGSLASRGRGGQGGENLQRSFLARSIGGNLNFSVCGEGTHMGTGQAEHTSGWQAKTNGFIGTHPAIGQGRERSEVEAKERADRQRRDRAALDAPQRTLRRRAHTAQQTHLVEFGCFREESIWVRSILPGNRSCYTTYCTTVQATSSPGQEQKKMASICHAITDPPVTKIRLWASFGV